MFRMKLKFIVSSIVILLFILGSQNIMLGRKFKLLKKGRFGKGYAPRWTEEIFEISVVQNTNPVT